MKNFQFLICFLFSIFIQVHQQSFADSNAAAPVTTHLQSNVPEAPAWEVCCLCVYDDTDSSLLETFKSRCKYKMNNISCHQNLALSKTDFVMQNYFKEKKNVVCTDTHFFYEGHNSAGNFEMNYLILKARFPKLKNFIEKNAGCDTLSCAQGYQDILQNLKNSVDSKSSIVIHGNQCPVAIDKSKNTTCTPTTLKITSSGVEQEFFDCHPKGTECAAYNKPIHFWHCKNQASAIPHMAPQWCCGSKKKTNVNEIVFGKWNEPGKPCAY